MMQAQAAGDSLTSTNGCLPGMLGVQYFSNRDLQGPPTIAEPWLLGDIDENWGTSAPREGIAEDNFSIRWIGMINTTCPAFDLETVTFTVDAYDGFRLYVDGQLLINQWNNLGVITSSASLSMRSGRDYEFRLEYRTGTFQSGIKVSWITGCSPFQTVIPTFAFSYPLSYPASFIDACTNQFGLPPGSFGLTTHRLRGLALARGIVTSTDRTNINVNRLVGRAFQNWVTERLNQDLFYILYAPIQENRGRFFSQARLSRTDSIQFVIPDLTLPLLLRSINPAESYLFQNSEWWEVKAMDGTLESDTRSYQGLGFFDAMTRPESNVAAYGATVLDSQPIHPEFIYATTANTSIGSSLIQEATNRDIYLRHIIACEISGTDLLFLGPMTNMNMEVYDGTEYLIFWDTLPVNPLNRGILPLPNPPPDMLDPDPAEVN
jgi:PA14 domain